MGKELADKLIEELGYNIRDVHIDCGEIIFDNEKQNTDSGGSGCGCSAVVFTGYLYKKLMKKEIKRVLLVSTGALMSTTCLLYTSICYVTIQDATSPKIIFLKNGKGFLLKDLLEEVKKKYLDTINEFYSSSCIEEKESIIENINEERNNYITKLMQMAKLENFDVKSTSGGFIFIPLKDGGNEMTQEEYDNLEEDTQEVIEKQASKRKNQEMCIRDRVRT